MYELLKMYNSALKKRYAQFCFMNHLLQQDIKGYICQRTVSLKLCKKREVKGSSPCKTYNNFKMFSTNT